MGPGKGQRVKQNEKKAKAGDAVVEGTLPFCLTVAPINGELLTSTERMLKVISDP